MPYTSLTDLIAKVQQDSERTDLSDATLTDYVREAEAYVSTKLRVRQMQTKATIAVASNKYALPSDYEGWYYVTAISSPRQPLEYLAPDLVDVLYPSRSSGWAKDFTIEGSYLYAFPYTTASVDLGYYATVPALTGAANWLLTKFPTIYLYGAMRQLWIANGDTEEVAKYAALLEAEIAGANVAHKVQSFANAGIRLSGKTP